MFVLIYLPIQNQVLILHIIFMKRLIYILFKKSAKKVIGNPNKEIAELKFVLIKPNLQHNWCTQKCNDLTINFVKLGIAICSITVILHKINF